MTREGVVRVNCFDDPHGEFVVLVNDERQHSLWPGSHDVPAGWRVVKGPESRVDCMTYIEDNGTALWATRPIESTSRRGD